MFNLGPEFTELAQNGLLRNLDDIAKANDWRGKLPQALVDAAQLDGHFYVVPTALNGQNFIWYNKALLTATGAAEPKTWQELFGVMDKVKARRQDSLRGGRPEELGDPDLLGRAFSRRRTRHLSARHDQA